MKKISTYSIESIADRYQFLELIGEGGMGGVLKAVDLVLNKEVAIKVLPSDHTGKGAARLQREATAAGKLNHPNIASILNFGQMPNGSPYMVMELICGKSLSALIHEKEFLSWKEAIPIFIQIGRALEYAHKNGVVHRDLKPSNIMIMEDSEGPLVKLLDFGVAKLENSSQVLTEKGVAVGSPLYMSPEQAMGEEVDFKSDIYSLGCLMYEVLSGKPPFSGQSPLETIAMHRKKKPVSLHELSTRENIPFALSELVDDCLEKKREHRPSDAAQILDRLSNLKEPEEEKIAQIAERETNARSNKNRNWLFSLFIAFLLVGGAVGFFLNNKQEKSKQTEIKSNATNFLTVPSTSELHAGLNESMSNKLSHLGEEDFDLDRLVVDDTKKLVLNETRKTDAELKSLMKLNKLKTLEISSSKITDKVLDYISELHSLETLKTDCPKFSENGLNKLGKLTHLSRLEITNNKIKPEVIQVLSGMNNLSRLTFKKCDFDLKTKNQNLKYTFSNLKNLDLIACSNWSECIKIVILPSVKVLSLRDTNLEADDFKKIMHLKKLVNLDFTESKVSPEGLLLISGLPELSMLCLGNVKNYSNDLIEALQKLKVNFLSLRKTKITDDQLMRLVSMQELNRIDVYGCDELSLEAAEKFRLLYKAKWGREVSVRE